MKRHIAVPLLAALALPAVAQVDSEFTVLVRNQGNNRTHYTKRALPDLERAEAFDGKYFKIVHKKSNEPIRFDEANEELLVRAATVYYHLSQSRSFWVTKMQSAVAAALPEITVRLDITNQFDELGHFAHDNRGPQFNNAVSIPAGETPEWVPAEKQDKWEKEIWFRPKKMIPTSELGPAGPNPLTVALRALEAPLLSYTQNQFEMRLMEQLFYPAYVTRPLHEDLIRYAGTYALMKIFIYGSKLADPLFMEKYYYLETAMVPEIASHEYAHLILSDHLAMSHSTPVNEGMADYFAAVQAGKKKIYAKVKGHSNAASKNTQEKKKYSHWDESNRLATGDFALSVLWDVREALGDEVGDRVVYQARKYLKTENSTLSEGLLRAILRACDDKCERPRRDKLKLYDVFMWKGF